MTLVATRPGAGRGPAVRVPGRSAGSRVAGGEVVAAHLPGQLLATAIAAARRGRRPGGRRAARAPPPCSPSRWRRAPRQRDSAAYALALEGLGAELSTSVDWDAFRVGVSAPVALLLDAVRLAGRGGPHPAAGPGRRRPGARRRGDRAADGLGPARPAGRRRAAGRPVRRRRAVRPAAARRPHLGGRGDRRRRARLPRSPGCCGRACCWSPATWTSSTWHALGEAAFAGTAGEPLDRGGPARRAAAATAAGSSWWTGRARCSRRCGSGTGRRSGPPPTTCR